MPYLRPWSVLCGPVWRKRTGRIRRNRARPRDLLRDLPRDLRKVRKCEEPSRWPTTSLKTQDWPPSLAVPKRTPPTIDLEATEVSTQPQDVAGEPEAQPTAEQAKSEQPSVEEAKFEEAKSEEVKSEESKG